MKNIDRFSPEVTAMLIRNAEHDRRWLAANGLLKKPDAASRPTRRKG